VKLNKGRREPMFVFVLDESLFKLTVKIPSFEPLFQLPERLQTRFTVRLYINLISQSYCGGENPPHPLKKGHKVGESRRPRSCQTNQSPKGPQRYHHSSHYSNYPSVCKLANLSNSNKRLPYLCSLNHFQRH